MHKLYDTSREFADLFGMANSKILSTNIHNGAFPLLTCRLGKLLVTNREVVNSYEQRRENDESRIFQ